MASNQHRLDRFISRETGIPKRHVRLLLAQKRITVNHHVSTDTHELVDQFSTIHLDGKILQDIKPIYMMLHKPKGVVSATQDAQHTTVIDTLRSDTSLALTQEVLDSLHIVGRLDLNSSGLLLLTNDSHWSKRLMSPDNKVKKVYEVGVQYPISDACIHAFSAGIYFSFEDITTQPAILEKLSDTLARVTLTEGKYHQIKRMFGRFRNPVLSLHRTDIGAIHLDKEMKEGAARYLKKEEYALFQ